MELKCPNCGSVIYSRRNPLCGACGEKLPEGVLFSPKQRQLVEKEMADLKRRRAQRQADRGSDASPYI